MSVTNNAVPIDLPHGDSSNIFCHLIFVWYMRFIYDGHVFVFL